MQNTQDNAITTYTPTTLTSRNGTQPPPPPTINNNTEDSNNTEQNASPASAWRYRTAKQKVIIDLKDDSADIRPHTHLLMFTKVVEIKC